MRPIQLLLLSLAACPKAHHETPPAYAILTEGSGEVVPADELLPLRVGWAATGVEIAEEPVSFAMISRSARSETGDGVVLTAGPVGPEPRFSWILDDTDDGVVARSAQGQVLDPPWLILPTDARDGTTWEIYDADGLVLATGALAAAADAWTLTIELAPPPVSADDLGTGVTLTPRSGPMWRAATGTPAAGLQPFFVYWNPLSPEGGPLRWRLIPGRGLAADTALVPGVALQTLVEPAVPMTEVGPIEGADWVNPWVIGAVVDDPAGLDRTSLAISGVEAGFAGEQNSQVVWGAALHCLWLPGGTYDNGLRSCAQPTHFDVSPLRAAATADGGRTTAPTVLGYSHFERLYQSPKLVLGGEGDDPFGFDDPIWQPLYGAFLGFYRGQDGVVRGLVHKTDEPAISHLAAVVPDDDRDDVAAGPYGHPIDRDFPAVPYYSYEHIDAAASRVARPAFGDVVRTIALAPEGPDGVPTLADAPPALGYGRFVADMPEGSVAAGYFPDYEVAGWIVDPISVTGLPDGSRRAVVVEAYGSVRELALVQDRLMWRSLGRPSVPAGQIAVGAVLLDGQVELVTQEGATRGAGAGGLQGVTDAVVRRWRFPARPGPWEFVPSHLFPGVDADGEDRVVCAPEGQQLGEVDFAAGGAVVLPTDERCALVLRPPRAELDLTGPAAPAEAPELRWERQDLGLVTVYGRGSLVALGGRHRVPAEDWEALRRAELPVLAGRHYDSLANPDRFAFPGWPAVLPERSGGHWVVEQTDVEGCPDPVELLGDAPEACLTVRFAAPDGAVQSWEVPAWGGTPALDLQPFGQETVEISWEGRVLPASDEGLYVWPGAWVSPTGGPQTFIGDACAGGEDAASSPAGPRPTFFYNAREAVDQRSRQCLDARGHAPSRGASTFVDPGGEGLVHQLYTDTWLGVLRLHRLPADATRALEARVGPLAGWNTGAGYPPIVSWRPHTRELFVGAQDDTGLAWVLFSTNAEGRAVERIAAGVAPPLPPETDLSLLQPLDLPFLPHPALRAPVQGCDPESEAATDAGCACAPGYARDGAGCTPVLGGAYLPAPSCAAIAAREGAAPPFVVIDSDGGARGAEPWRSDFARWARCTEDGFTELIDDPIGGTPAVGPDLMVAGDFRVDLPGSPTFALSTQRRPGPDELLHAWGLTPADLVPEVELLGEPRERRDLPQRLTLRVRSTVTDLGPMVDGAYRIERTDGALRVLRDGVTIAEAEYDVSPLFVEAWGTAYGNLVPATVAFAGHDCLPAGADFAGEGCVAAPQSCEARAHECGLGDDGALGMIDCGACDAGLTCAYNRCECTPDAWERPGDPVDAYPRLGSVGLDGAPWTVTFPALTLDHPADHDSYELWVGDAGYQLPNELEVRLVSDSPYGFRVRAGIGTGCSWSCVGATPTTLPWGGGTIVGCEAEGVGEAVVRFQLGCDPFTLDAERGAYYVQVEATEPAVRTCATYDLVVSSRAVLP